MERERRHYQQLLARFDPVGLYHYDIAAADLRRIERYVHILQAGLGETVWDEVLRVGGFYGASVLVHKIVEIRALQNAGIDPCRYTQYELAGILANNLSAHVVAIYEEHRYLQGVLLRQYGSRFEVATLIKANRADERDLTYFLESDIGLFLLEEERVEEARVYLSRLKREEV